jgi:hypothetical protein
MGSPKKKSEYRLSLFNQQDNESLQSASTDWKTQESDFFFGSNNRFDAQLQHRDDVSSYEAQNFNNGSICSDSEYDIKTTSEMPWSEDSYNSNEQVRFQHGIHHLTLNIFKKKVNSFLNRIPSGVIIIIVIVIVEHPLTFIKQIVHW